ncbi:PHD finger protein 14 [Geranomyces michiganensis]|nr:PHD finger protein 14 [Geranomyces michiganensis]
MQGSSSSSAAVVACANRTCTVVVHPACHPSHAGTTTASIKAAAGAATATTEWLCQRCCTSTLDPDIAACALCPIPDGLLERIEHTGIWIHTLCKMWIMGHRDGRRGVREKELRGGALDAKLWVKPCSFCSTSSSSNSSSTISGGDAGAGGGGGCTRACDAHGCKNSVHAPCAAAYGCLETDPNPDLSDPHFVYCKLHGTNDPRLNAWAKWARKKHEILDKLDTETLRVATPADLMDPRTAMDTYFAKFDLDQRRVIVQLQRDELCYAAAERADREATARLIKEAKWLETAIADQQRMDDAATEETTALQNQLLRIFPFLKQCDAGIETTPANIIDAVFNTTTTTTTATDSGGSGVKPEFTAAFAVAYDIAKSAHCSPPRQTQSFSSTPNSLVAGRGGRRGANTKLSSHKAAGSHMGLCTICKTFEGTTTPSLTPTTDAGGASPFGTPPPPPPLLPPSSLPIGKTPETLKSATARRLIRCSSCGCSFHMGCLDPPLKKMPPRGYDWQCESCDESPEEDDDDDDDDDDNDEGQCPSGRKRKECKVDSDSSEGNKPRPKRNRGPPVRYQ